jgi:hypothetical protein
VAGQRLTKIATGRSRSNTARALFRVTDLRIERAKNWHTVGIAEERNAPRNSATRGYWLADQGSNLGPAD